MWVLTVWLAIAIAAVSMTIAKSGFFKGTRRFVAKRSAFFGELLQCPYCVSHWLSFAAVAYYRPRLVTSNVALVDYFVTAMILVALAALIAGLIFRAFLGYRPPDDEND